MKTIPYAHQFIDSNDIKEVIKILKSDWLTQGPKVKEFESALCQYTDAKYAVVVSSGTAALHLSMIALGLGPGDKLVTSPITFAASANCAIYVGAAPEFVDIDDKTYHIDVERLIDLLESPSARRKVKVVVPVHLMGTVVDLSALRRVCSKYGIKIVEDAAHAIGARYKCGNAWVKVGSCRHSDVTIFSFHPIKHITTGEGGAILTNDKRLYDEVLRLRHHGIVKQKSDIGWRYDIVSLGFNYRITDFQCALGLSQLKRLDDMVKERRRMVEVYNSGFADIKEITLPYQHPQTHASYHLYVIRVSLSHRDKLYRYLQRKGVSTQVNYMPLYRLSYYRKTFRYKVGDYPVAEKYFKECLSLPLYCGLTDCQQRKVVKIVKGYFS